MTTLELDGPDSELHLKFLSRLGKRERRAVIRSFLVQIRPWIQYFTRAAIDHSHDGLIRERRAVRRGVNILQSNPLSSLPGALGFKIRMKRLELGLSQTQLSEMTGIRRSHLSDLERGLHLPNAKTRAEIERVLKIRVG